MVAAIIESLNALNQQENTDIMISKIIFDPAAFRQANPAPILQEFMKNQEELLKWAKIAIYIWKSQKETSEALGRENHLTDEN